MAASAFPHLLAPIQLGAVRVANRILMGSMRTNLEDSDENFRRLAEAYALRARGGTGLIVTGGFSPNAEGRMNDQAPTLTTSAEAKRHRVIAQAVHDAGAACLLQVLHSGRYGHHKDIVAPSPVRSPINRDTPREMTPEDIERTLDDFARAAALAQEAGYDGVEIMGSEGYLITQFLALHTNLRTDAWGGSFANRMRFAVEAVRRTRARVGAGFIIMYRISVLDLLESGQAWEEIAALAKAVEAAGATLLNTGIGWHEARIPTIAGAVPRLCFAWTARKLKQEVALPVVAVNRINTPADAEKLIAEGSCDLVSLARPLLADPEFGRKAASGRAAAITHCIACNQACLDHYFDGKRVTCLMNPTALREDEFPSAPAIARKRVAVVGAGPAGIAAALAAERRGHAVTLFESEAEIGGQFRLARRVPGKEEFGDAIRSWVAQLGESKVELRTGRAATAGDLVAFDAVVLASGIRPRAATIPGIESPLVMGYLDYLSGRRKADKNVVVIGGGGIAFDVALALVEEGSRGHLDPTVFARHWGIDFGYAKRGGLGEAEETKAPRKVTILQRTPGKGGKRLGRSTGWIHRLTLQRQGVEVLGGVRYDRVDGSGIHVEVDGRARFIAADTIIVCAGQEPMDQLARELAAKGRPFVTIGGAREAANLDAKRAIEEGLRAGLAI